MAEIDPSGKGMRSVEISRKLGKSRASVHSMMNELEKIGCLTKSYYGIVFLSDKGMEIAKYYQDKDTAQ